MKNKELLMQSLLSYTEEETVYKKLYELTGQSEERRKYLAEIEDFARDHHMFIPDFSFGVPPELFSEDTFYPHLAISRGSNVNIVKHLRFTPVFRHSHTFFAVVYVLSGSCGHTLDGKDAPLKKGDVAFIPPFTPQTIEVFDDSVVLSVHIRKDTFADIFFNVLRYNNILSDFFMSHLYSKSPAKSILFPTGDDEEILDIILSMYEEVLLDDAYSWRLLNNLVPLFFAKLLRGYSDSAVITDYAQLSETRSKRLRLLSYINDNYRNVSLEELADHFHYSVPHCSKLIREETGIGFVAFVRRVKMNHAESLLVNTKTSIADISELVGYENPESFIRAFQKLHQMSPSAYRKEQTRKREASAGDPSLSGLDTDHSF